MKKTDGRQAVYAKRRAQTAAKIQDAIDYIQEDGRVVTKKELQEITGLSSGSFSQPYILEILKKNRVCQFKNVGSKKPRDSSTSLKKEYDQIIVENSRLKSKIQDYEIECDKEKKKYNDLYESYKDLEYQHQLLRGKYQQLREFLEIQDININDMPMN